jgi:hypothetical protein
VDFDQVCCCRAGVFDSGLAAVACGIQVLDCGDTFFAGNRVSDLAAAALMPGDHKQA